MNNIENIKKESQALAMSKAQVRDEYYEGNNYVIQDKLYNDLSTYLVDDADLSRMRYITLDFFLNAFLDKICNVYDNAPVIQFQNGTDKDKANFNKLMDEVNINNIFKENIKRMKLHNTIIPMVKYHKKLDKIYIDNTLNVGNTVVWEYEGFCYEWEVLAYLTEIQNELIWVVWDRELEEQYLLATDNKVPEFDRNKKTLRVGTDEDFYSFVGENEDYKIPDYNPYIIYREKLQNDFWGNGLDSIIELIRNINMLLTITSDDTIQETIRLLILNFDPTGTEGESGQLKAGLRHPLVMKNDAVGNTFDPKGEVVSADLYNEQVIALTEKLIDIISSMHNIENPIKTELKENLSGVALKLRTEPLLRDWASDINTVRYYDMKLLKTIVEVNNYYRTDKINEKLIEGMNIDYREPNIVTDVKEEYSLEKEKWEDGVSSPIEYVQQNNPEMTPDQAKEYIKNNKAVNDELFGIKTPEL